jgi:hypothetical protein
MRSLLAHRKPYITGLMIVPVLVFGASLIVGDGSAAPPKFKQPNSDALPIDAANVDATPTPKSVSGGAVVFDQPVLRPVSAGPGAADIRLPVRLDMLAVESPEAEEAEKTAELREELQKVIEEKASLLNATALAAEIELHRRQIDELKALQELQRLQKNLEELSDKFPDSDAGRRAREVLNLLKNAGPRPTLRPDADVFDVPRRPTTAPAPDDGFRDDRIPRRKPALEPDIGGEGVRNEKVVPPRKDTFDPPSKPEPKPAEEQPIRPKTAPNPKEETSPDA